MNIPKVVHLKVAPYDVRIDRQTHWGNPFVIGKDGNRQQVIEKYRTWILSEPSIVAMAQRDLRGKTLGCWCAPKACHGDVLVEIANKEVWWCSGCSRYHVDQSTDLSGCSAPTVNEISK